MNPYEQLINNKNIISEEELENLIPFETLNYRIGHSGVFEEDFSKIMSREKFIEKFGIFGIPSSDSLDGIIEFAQQNKIQSIIDVGAGYGYLAYGLDKIIKQKNYNMTITAIDDVSFWINSVGLKKWFDVQNIRATDYLKDVKDSLVIMCWPDYNTDFAYEVANIVLQNNNRLIYIGEPEYGCTANDNFFNSFHIKSLPIPWASWFSIHDNIFEVIL